MNTDQRLRELEQRIERLRQAKRDQAERAIWPALLRPQA
jgi:hypothetical protein